MNSLFTSHYGEIICIQCGYYLIEYWSLIFLYLIENRLFFHTLYPNHSFPSLPFFQLPIHLPCSPDSFPSVSSSGKCRLPRDQSNSIYKKRYKKIRQKSSYRGLTSQKKSMNCFLMISCYTHTSVPAQLSSERLPLAGDGSKLRDPQPDNMTRESLNWRSHLGRCPQR